MRLQYEDLIGYTFEEYKGTKDTDGDDCPQGFPTFIASKNGTKIMLSVSVDDEGNGGGVLFIDHICQTCGQTVEKSQADG